MKVIISHDVDHITFWEHNRDLIIPKYIVQGFIELSLGRISVFEIVGRIKKIFQNKRHKLEELMRFNKENSIPSDFFVGVSNGKGLSYTIEDAELWIKKILLEGFDVGVHGISYARHNEIKNEYDTFKCLTNLKKFGIRMHYLRHNTNTLEFLNNVNYSFDCSIFEMKNPFKVGNMWEFPLHIMDCYIICKNSKWQNQNLKQSKETTKRIMEEADEAGIKYLSILFHDRFFCDSFKTWKEWYIWLIGYLKENKFKFISYKEAINELEDSL